MGIFFSKNEYAETMTVRKIEMEEQDRKRNTSIPVRDFSGFIYSIAIFFVVLIGKLAFTGVGVWLTVNDILDIQAVGATAWNLISVIAGGAILLFVLFRWVILVPWRR